MRDEIQKVSLKGIIKRKRTTSQSKGSSRERSSLTRLVSPPQPGTCPSCRMPYDRSYKRRLVDSCGHERCYTCIGRNDICSLCLQTGISPHKVSRAGNASSTKDTSLSSSGPSPVFKHDIQCVSTENTSIPSSTLGRSKDNIQTSLHDNMQSSMQNKIETRMKTSMQDNLQTSLQMGTPGSTLDRTKRSRLANTSMDSGFFSNTNVSCYNSSPDNTLPRRRKQVVKNHDLKKSNSSTLVEGKTTLRPTHANLFSRKLSRLSTGHIHPNFPKPLYFEVPQCLPSQLSGRQWLFHEMREHMSSHLSTNRGVILAGGPGVGKTACILAMVERSCFGSAKLSKDFPSTKSSSVISGTPEDKLSLVSRHLVAYHFCQADNAPTCLLPQFVHSISAQMSQAPQLSPYFQLLQSDQTIQARLSLASCIASPSKSLITGILEPLNTLSSTGKIPASMCIIVVDGLCEAEQHRPDYGDTLASFITKHLHQFPSWLKIVCTVRSSIVDATRLMPFHTICLDNIATDERLNKDLSDYIDNRLKENPQMIQNKSKMTKNLTTKLTSHLVSKANGCFLYVKLILDFMKKGCLVIKSGSFKVLPLNLSEIYNLAFSLKFSSSQSFEQVSDLLSISLASLQPINLHELFTIFSSLSIKTEVTWNEFNERYQLISDLLVIRKDGSVMCFHPTLRDWLLRNQEKDPNKFLLDIRSGHTAIALSMSRQAKMLKPEKVLELSHHILKSNLYKNIGQELNFSHRELQAFLVSLAADDISLALGCNRNIFAPIIKVSRLLLLSGGNPNYTTEHMDHCPLLGIYSCQGNTDMVSLLLEYGADANRANARGVAPLALASGSGHLDIVKLLVQCGAQINRVDNEGVCALVMAARGGYLAVLEYLLDQDWMMDMMMEQLGLEEGVQQAVVATITHGNHLMTEMLLDLPSVDINTSDTLTGLTPLCAASTVGDRMCAEMLIKRQAAVNQWDIVHQQAPIHLAAREGHCDIVACLVAQGASVNQVDGKGRTALMLSAAGGHAGLVELLVHHGAGLEDADKEAITPLTHTIIHGHCEIAQFLLNGGANVNAVDCSGRSPLDVAVYQGNSEMVDILLDNGANMEKTDIRGIKPLDRVIGFGNADVVSVFLKKGAKLGPATWLMAEGKPDIQLILLNKLLEDGNTLYRQNKLPEAAHRYRYAIKRIPRDNPEWQETFSQLEIHLFLNLSRCERRQGQHHSAVHLASQVVSSHPHCVEAHTARAKAHKAMGMSREALLDFSSALELAPYNNDIKKAIMKLNGEIGCENQLVKLPPWVGSSESFQFMEDCSSAWSSK